MTEAPTNRSLQPSFLRRAGLGLVGIFLLLALATMASTPAPPPLADELDRLLDAPGVRSAFWGVYVQDVATGEVLYERNGDKRLVPASNLKLFTTTTALDELTSEYRYHTVLYFKGSVIGDTLVGDLVIRGSGDPTFGSGRFRRDPLREWARQLADLGVRLIKGRIIGDDDVFDDAAYPEGWDVNLIGTQSYATSIGGLSYHDNIVDLVVRGGRRAGILPTVQESPTAYFSVRNRAGTSQSRRSSLRIRRETGSEAVILEGAIGEGQNRRITVPVNNPTRFTLVAFASWLQDVGIALEADLLDVDDLPARLDYNGAQPLLAYISPPLLQIIGLVNKNSNNFYAEQLFRTFSPRGSAHASEERVKALLRKAGIPDEDLSIQDGSGLSRKDLVTPRAIVHLLRYMYEHPEREVFTRSLPRGGERGTTLARRLDDVTVQAKTGSLEFVRALSGYVFTRNNRVLAFSLLANNYASGSGAISSTQDAIVRTLAAYNGP